jgi:hypothetical protein
MALTPGSTEPHVVIYEDFDFDGQRDLAVLDGYSSCYGGESYEVFLRGPSGFKRSPSFSALSHNFCGMFEVDRKRKRLQTFSKSGCCYHTSQEWDVVAHEPRLVQEVIEEAGESAYVLTSRHVRGQPSSKTYALALENEPAVESVLAFDLPGPKRQHVEVFISQGELDYAFVNGDGRKVELSYALNVARPLESRGKTAAPFVYDAVAGELAFRNGGYRYVVVDKGPKVGVRVEHQGNSVFLSGIGESQSGSLRALSAKKLANLRANAQ